MERVSWQYKLEPWIEKVPDTSVEWISAICPSPGLWYISTHSLSAYCVLGLCTGQKWSEVLPKALASSNLPRRPCSQSSYYVMYMPFMESACFHHQAFACGTPPAWNIITVGLDLIPQPSAGLCLGATSS